MPSPPFLDASLHLYMRVYPSVCLSVCPLAFMQNHQKWRFQPARRILLPAWACFSIILFAPFLDAPSHLYKRLCPSVRRSVCDNLWRRCVETSQRQIEIALADHRINFKKSKTDSCIISGPYHKLKVVKLNQGIKGKDKSSIEALCISSTFFSRHNNVFGHSDWLTIIWLPYSA